MKKIESCFKPAFSRTLISPRPLGEGKGEGNTLKPAFSLMEMMIVLLIISIIAAVSAPMVTRKLSRDSRTGDNPWVFTNLAGNVGFNIRGRDVTSIIGATSVPSLSSFPISGNPRLYIDGSDSNVGLAFGKNGTLTGYLNMDTDSNIVAGTGYVDGCKGSILIGKDAGKDAHNTDSSKYENVILIGNNTKVKGLWDSDHYVVPDNAIAIGNNADVALPDAIAIGSGTRSYSHRAVVIGESARAEGTAPDTAHDMIAIGSEAKVSDAEAIAVGSSAHAKGEHSIAIGSYRDAGSNAIAIGQGVWKEDTVGSDSIVIGNEAKAVKGDSIVIGHNANSGDISGSGKEDVVIGYKASATGYNAGRNVVIGYEAIAGKDTVAGSNNVVIGYKASASNNSVALGSNIAIGSGASAGHTGHVPGGNIAFGTGAKAEMGSIAIGSSAEAKKLNSIAIGNGVKPTNDNEIVIGNTDHTMYVPGNINVRSSAFYVQNMGTYNKIQLSQNNSTNTGIFLNDMGSIVMKGNTTMHAGNITMNVVHDGSSGSISLIGNTSISNGVLELGTGGYLGSNFQQEIRNIVWGMSASDRRLKNVGKKFEGGLAELKKLDLYHFTYKNDKDKTPHVGVMAQDLQKVFPDAVTKGKDGYFMIRKEDMFFAVVNAVKELDRRLTELAKKVAANFDEITKLKATIAEQQKTIDTLKAQNADFEKRLAKLEKKLEK